MIPYSLPCEFYFLYLFILFIWLCQVLVVARGIFLVVAYKVLVAVCELLAAGCAI